LRKTQPVFQRRHFFQGRAIHGPDLKDLYWLKADGSEMSDGDWNAGHVSTLGMVLTGDQITETDEHGQRRIGGTFALLLNSDREPVPFTLGSRQRDVYWRCIFDTAVDDSAAEARVFDHTGAFPLQPRSFALLRAEDASL